MVRVFIAVEPSAAIRQNIASAGNELRGAGRLALVSSDLMHITLKFLGEVPESSLPNITTALDSVSAAPYQIHAAGVGKFGRPARVIKAEIHDGGETAALAKDIDTRLAKLGFPKETKPFSPHITIARVKEYARELDEKAGSIKDLDFGTCTIDQILLKKSVLTPSGPIYTTIHRVSL